MGVWMVSEDLATWRSSLHLLYSLTKVVHLVGTIAKIKPSSAYFNENNRMTGGDFRCLCLCVFVCVCVCVCVCMCLYVFLFFLVNASHVSGCNLTVTGNVFRSLCTCV